MIVNKESSGRVRSIRRMGGWGTGIVVGWVWILDIINSWPVVWMNGGDYLIPVTKRLENIKIWSRTSFVLEGGVWEWMLSSGAMYGNQRIRLRWLMVDLYPPPSWGKKGDAWVF